ncbi:MAG: hypothetical protein ACR2H2_19990 [Solirubrobacteraceae bacterium]
MERSDDTEDEPDFETREERAAAAEAAAIGGSRVHELGLPGTGEHLDEALRPVYEAGGGESEGFEIAERDLERNASHDDGQGYPERDAFTPEHESDRSTATYAEADEEEHPDL